VICRARLAGSGWQIVLIDVHESKCRRTRRNVRSGAGGNRTFDPLALNVGAIGAFEVLDKRRCRINTDPEVVPRQRVIRHWQTNRVVAPDGNPICSKQFPSTSIWSGDNDEIVAR